MADAEMSERVAKTEWAIEAMEKRLAEGAGAFSDLRMGMREVEERVIQGIAPRPIQVWRLLGLSFSVLCVLIGVVWTMAGYPDRGEFSSAIEEVQEVQAAYESQHGEAHATPRKELQDLQRDLALIQARIVALEKAPKAPTRRGR